MSVGCPYVFCKPRLVAKVSVTAIKFAGEAKEFLVTGDEMSG
jgi:hypothetical protein